MITFIKKMNVLHTIGFYAILNYADKFLTFIIPLLVLRFHSDLYRDLSILLPGVFCLLRGWILDCVPMFFLRIVKQRMWRIKSVFYRQVNLFLSFLRSSICWSELQARWHCKTSLSFFVAYEVFSCCILRCSLIFAVWLITRQIQFWFRLRQT